MITVTKQLEALIKTFKHLDKLYRKNPNGLSQKDSEKRKTILAYLLKEIIGPEIEPVHPDNPDRRAHLRMPHRVHGSFTVTASENPELVYEGEVLNISASGAYMQTKNPAKAGAILSLKLKLEVELTPWNEFETPARVVWCRPQPTPRGDTGMGLFFLEIPKDKKELLEDYILKILYVELDKLIAPEPEEVKKKKNEATAEKAH